MNIDPTEARSTLLEIDGAYRGERRPKFMGDVVDAIARCVSRGLLRPDAFIKHTTIANQPKFVLMASRYPFTPEGDRELAALHASVTQTTGDAAATNAADDAAQVRPIAAQVRPNAADDAALGPPRHPAERDHRHMKPRELTHYLASLTALAEDPEAPATVAEKRREVELAFASARRKQLISRIVWTAVGVVAVAVVVLLLSGAGYA
ncbi:MAG: hypothetical protein ACOCYC_04750 [bacterium]